MFNFLVIHMLIFLVCFVAGFISKPIGLPLEKLNGFIYLSVYIGSFFVVANGLKRGRDCFSTPVWSVIVTTLLFVPGVYCLARLYLALAPSKDVA